MKHNKKINLVFMGTPEIAVPTLLKLNEFYNIQAVVTVPDKPKGRGQKLSYSPVKEAALSLALPVLQPEKMSEAEFINKIKILEPDIIIVFAFRIIPQDVYNASKIATFNIHTSLLPAYRGAAPINWAIINGDEVTGITTFILQDKIDTGGIILQKKIKILKNYTSGNLHDQMMIEAPGIAIETCEKLLSGNYEITPQDEKIATLAPKIFRKDAEINFNIDSKQLANFINGYSPIPCAWTKSNNLILKIYHAESCSKLPEDIVKNINIQELKIGEFLTSKSEIFIKCSEGFIKVLELQLEGKKRMMPKEFLLGYRNF